MKTIENNTELISMCGLYCGACNSYLKEKCPGCSKNEKATWCAVRSCCLENSYKSCADCIQYSNPMECKKYNNFMSKIFGFIFRSNRNAGIDIIKEKGYAGFAEYMAMNKLQTLRR